MLQPGPSEAATLLPAHDTQGSKVAQEFPPGSVHTHAAMVVHRRYSRSSASASACCSGWRSESGTSGVSCSLSCLMSNTSFKASGNSSAAAWAPSIAAILRKTMEPRVNGEAPVRAPQQVAGNRQGLCNPLPRGLQTQQACLRAHVCFQRRLNPSVARARKQPVHTVKATTELTSTPCMQGRVQWWSAAGWHKAGARLHVLRPMQHVRAEPTS